MEELEEHLEERCPPGATAGLSTPSYHGPRRAIQLAAVGFLAGFLYLFSPFLLVLVGWFLDPYSDVGGEAPISHRVHEVTFGLLFALALIGALSQVRRPERNIAGMQQSLVAVVVFVSVSWATTGFEPVALAYLIPVLVAVASHPDPLRVVLPRGRPSAALALLAVVGSLPFLEMAGRELGKAAAGAQGHESHWGTTAAFAITVVVLTWLVVLRQPGWRVTAASLGLGVLGYVTVSVAFPFDSSARPDSWATFAAIFALALLVVAIGGGRPGQVTRATAALVWAGGLLAALIVGFGWSVGGGPPRVPHQVAGSQLDREGCLSCHLEANTSVTGATPTPHPLEVCGDDEYDPPCRTGQPACLACHQLAESAVAAVDDFALPKDGPRLPRLLLEVSRRW